MTYGSQLKDFQDKMAKPLEQLQYLVGKVDYDGISSFFRQYLPKDINYSSNCSMLAQMIVLKPEFFKPYGILSKNIDDAEKLKEEHILRYCYVLNHMTIHSQLFLLNHLITHQSQIDVNIDYFKTTHLHFEKYHRTEQKEKVLEIAYWGRIISALFRRDDFKVIDSLEEQFSFPFLKQKSDSMILYYLDNKPARSGKKMMFNYTDSVNQNGSFEHYETVKLGHKILKPYFYIIFDYSQKKENYLNGKALVLPSLAEVQKIETSLHQLSLFIPDGEEQKNLWNEKLQEYKKRISYYELEHRIEVAHGLSDNTYRHTDEKSGKLKI